MVRCWKPAELADLICQRFAIEDINSAIRVNEDAPWEVNRVVRFCVCCTIGLELN